jgi:hypothetical protein
VRMRGVLVRVSGWRRRVAALASSMRGVVSTMGDERQQQGEQGLGGEEAQRVEQEGTRQQQSVQAREAAGDVGAQGDVEAQQRSAEAAAAASPDERAQRAHEGQE